MDIKAINVPLPPPPATADFSNQQKVVPPVEPVKGARVDREPPESREPEQARVIRSGDMEFRIDADTNKLVVSIFDRDGELLQQIPADTVLRIARQIDTMMQKGSLGVELLA